MKTLFKKSKNKTKNYFCSFTFFFSFKTIYDVDTDVAIFTPVCLVEVVKIGKNYDSISATATRFVCLHENLLMK